MSETVYRIWYLFSQIDIFGILAEKISCLYCYYLPISIFFKIKSALGGKPSPYSTGK